ncbi:alkylation response protein AidB-like acyl-CoA dehydrogenase [Bradyrhizobium yuanmingense]
MNFDFSDDQKQLRDQARKFLTEKCSPKAVRVVLDGKAPYDKELWKGLAEMGFLGVAIPRGVRRRRRRSSRAVRDRGRNGPG